MHRPRGKSMPQTQDDEVSLFPPLFYATRKRIQHKYAGLP